MLILKIRQAETALRDGRLDEAFELARIEAVQSHRKGQDLIGRLARAFVARGRDHLAGGRFAQAAADGEKAVRLAGNLGEVAELREAIRQATSDQQRQQHRHLDAVAAAREHIDNGRLSIGQRMLDVASEDDVRAARLRGEAEARRREAAVALGRAEEAFQREDWVMAVEALVKATETHAGNPQLADITAHVTGRMIERTRSAINAGRLDQADLLLRTLRPVGGRSIDAHELQSTIDQCRLVASAIEQGRPRRAGEILRRLRTIVPDAVWIDDALADVQRAAEATERLRGGPLGLLMPGSERQAAAPGPTVNTRPGGTTVPIHMADRLRVEAPASPAVTAPAVPASPAGAGSLPKRLMLHVDGVGSFLVLRDRWITIGPAGGSRPLDVGLLADSGLAGVTVERVDEDYFVSSVEPVEVNNVPATRKLLADGDRIALSSRCRMRFNVPNAASTTAVLSVSGTRLPGSDARRVVLLDESLVIGPGSSAHIRADQLASPAILHMRDGRLFCNTTAEVLVDDRPADRQAGLPLDVPIRIGCVSLVVKAA